MLIWLERPDLNIIMGSTAAETVDATPDVALCPSAPAQVGALLIGVVQEGAVALLGTPLTVDQGFVDIATEHGKPERRFRFSVPCVEDACAHWTNSACGLIGVCRAQATQAGLVGPVDDALPRCAIRARCRWWRQEGRNACSTCAFVVYDPTHPPTV